uniref:Chitin-binding type-2 domain-containing protein n=1 Tax=Syphacia muris TaxID=451379 RepID=A0A0N5AV76_9BILA
MVRHFLNPRNCTKFYRCASVERLECPDGKLFSFEMQNCLNIGLNSAEIFDENNEITRTRQSMIHRFIDPQDIHTFYRCLDQPTAFTCPSNTVFNEISEVCDWRRNVPRCT